MNEGAIWETIAYANGAGGQSKMCEPPAECERLDKRVISRSTFYQGI